MAVLGGGTPYAVVDLCALFVLVLGEKDQLFGGEGDAVVIFVLFFLVFHVVS